jgi:hypothetical protein
MPQAVISYLMRTRHHFNKDANEQESALFLQSISSNGKVNSHIFYHQNISYHGHKIDQLEQVLSVLRRSKGSIAFLAGDSSLDNKFWINEPEQRNRMAVGLYSDALEPPVMVGDVAYHLTRSGASMGIQALNCAIEESTLRERQSTLTAQDVFIRDNISSDDILVISVGGNDIALASTLVTKLRLIQLFFFNRNYTLLNQPQNAWGFGHFVDLFERQLKNYALKLIEKKQPKLVLLCMIYFPDQKMTGSWADRVLGFLGYNSKPQLLQSVIKSLFTHAISKIKLEGTKTDYIPLFEALDGKDTFDYVARVEPSYEGGAKMAKLVLECCARN